MSRPIRFTIVTPSFNQARYIGQTIESVLTQEGEFEIEYLVMDGGSTDGAVNIIRDYAERVKTGQCAGRCRSLRMEWVSEKDGGQSDAINRGLRRSSGEIAAYINSDDVYLPGAFAAVARAFEECPSTMLVHGDGEVVDEDGRLQWEWLSRPYDHSVMTSYHFLWNNFTNYIMQPSTFWRANVHTALGGFDESFDFALDAEFWIRAGQARLRFQHLPRKLAQFRMIAGTKSSSSPVAFWSDYLEIFRRYRGTSQMAIYFGYYCFNVALHCGFDLDRAQHEQARMLNRWSSLPDLERRKLGHQASKGFALGCYLVANALQRLGRFDEAAAALSRGKAECRSAARHPIALFSRLKQSLPLHGAVLLDGLSDRIADLYRRKRVDYRYHQQ